MTLDERDPPVTIDEAMQYARDDILRRLEEKAEAEASLGDGRALRVFQRLVEACGLGVTG